jgi:hypothetical protein
VTWEEVTAVSTLGLAAVTFGLARSTRKLAREANAETRANWRPVLVPEVEDASTGAKGLSLDGRLLSMRIRNIGRGPALTVTAALWVEGERGYPDPVFRGRAGSNVVAPGERITFEWHDFDAPRPPSVLGLQAWSQLDGMITYGDVGYVRYETEVKVGFRIDGVAELLDHRFLGAARDRIGRVERVRLRALQWALTFGPRAPRILRPITRALARVAVKRLG